MFPACLYRDHSCCSGTSVPGSGLPVSGSVGLGPVVVGLGRRVGIGGNCLESNAIIKKLVILKNLKLDIFLIVSYGEAVASDMAASRKKNRNALIFILRAVLLDCLAMELENCCVSGYWKVEAFI